MSGSLWLIVYSAGVIGGFAGPLPYDMAECISRRDEMRQSQVEGLERGVNLQTLQPMTAEERKGVEGLRFECEVREDRPVLGGQ